jgi:hypothetical protein
MKQLLVAGIPLLSWVGIAVAGASCHHRNEKMDAGAVSMVSSYLSGMRYMHANFEQLTGNDGKIYQGEIWLSKGKNETQEQTTKKVNPPKIRVQYTGELDQDVIIIDENVTTYEHKAGKQYKYSIANSPVYSIIIGRIKVNRDKVIVLENSKKWLRIKLEQSALFKNLSIILVFSKYEHSGNIEYLTAWIIDDGKTETMFSLDPQTLSINDAKKVPDSVFVVTTNTADQDSA